MENTRGFELPDLQNIDTPLKASETINKIMSDAFGSEGKHPWLDGNSPQHADFVRVVGELHEIRTRDEGTLTPLEKGMQAAVDSANAAQEKRVSEGEKLMDELTDLGFDRTAVPADITRYEIRGLSQQLMVARGEWDEALRQIQDDLGKLSPPEDISKLISIIRQTPDSEKSFKDKLFSRLVFWIHKEKNRRYGRLDIF